VGPKKIRVKNPETCKIKTVIFEKSTETKPGEQCELGGGEEAVRLLMFVGIW